MIKNLNNIFQNSLIFHFGRIITSDPDEKTAIQKEVLRKPDERIKLSMSDFISTFGVSNVKTSLR